MHEINLSCTITDKSIEFNRVYKRPRGTSTVRSARKIILKNKSNRQHSLRIPFGLNNSRIRENTTRTISSHLSEQQHEATATCSLISSRCSICGSPKAALKVRDTLSRVECNIKAFRTFRTALHCFSFTRYICNIRNIRVRSVSFSFPSVLSLFLARYVCVSLSRSLSLALSPLNY